MKYARMYTVKRERLEDVERITRQVTLAAKRFIESLNSQWLLVSDASVMVTDQNADYFMQNKVAILIEANCPENEITIISED